MKHRAVIFCHAHSRYILLFKTAIRTRTQVKAFR